MDTVGPAIVLGAGIGAFLGVATFPLLPRLLQIAVVLMAVVFVGTTFRLWPVYDRGEMPQSRFDALLARVYASDVAPKATFIDFTAWFTLDSGLPHPYIQKSWFHRLVIGDASIFDVVGIGPLCYPIAAYPMSVQQFQARDDAERQNWHRQIEATQ